MVRFFCRRCSFKYAPKTGSTSLPAKCGNCGGNGTVEYEPSAQDIIRDAK